MYYNIKNSPKAWYNKFGIYKIYEETELKDSWFHISLVSHDREDDIAKGTNNFLTLASSSLILATSSSEIVLDFAESRKC